MVVLRLHMKRPRFMILLTIIVLTKILKSIVAMYAKTVNSLTGSYIAYVDEETFLANPSKYIDNAYDKSENDASGYDLTKSR